MRADWELRSFIARLGRFRRATKSKLALPHSPHPQPLGAIGENRKDLGNTNIQVRNLKGFTPKPAEMAEY